MTELTIGILASGKDAGLLPSLLARIGRKVTGICYEVLVYDNRDDTGDALDAPGARVLGGGGNVRQLAARRRIIEEAGGELLWFVDADDDIFEVNASFLHPEADITAYPALKVRADGSEWWHWYPDAGARGADDGGTLMGEMPGIWHCLWDKIIRTDVLRRVIPFISDGDRVSASEDTVYVAGALTFGRTLLYESRPIYTYRADRSSSDLSDYSGQYGKFEACIFGLARAREILLEMCGWSEVMADCRFYIEKCARTTDAETRERMFARFREDFTDGEILMTWRQWLIGGQGLSEDDYGRLVALLEGALGDLIRIRNRIAVERVLDDGSRVTEYEDDYLDIGWRAPAS